MATPRQSSLFDEGSEKTLSVVEVLDRAKPTDKAQATFQRLVTRIEQQRASFKLWHDYLPRYNQRVSGELIPLHDQLWQYRQNLALLFDDILSQPGRLRGKRQRAQLQQLLVGLIQELLDEKPDSALEAIHDKYNDLTYAEDQEFSMALSQDMVENILGIDLGDEYSASNLEELLVKAEQELHARAFQQQQEREQRQAKKHKTRKAEEADAKREQAAREISQSVREVYRKLASALHPDRETDHAVRQQRTEQMQRVNQAYEAGDLLTLLNIQLEIEQIDAEHLATLPVQRLAHYNQILKEQLAELKAETDSVIAPFMRLVPYARHLTPDMVDRALGDELARLEAMIVQVKDDLEDFKDSSKLAASLKAAKPYVRHDEFDDLSYLQDVFAPAAPARRKKPGKKR